MFVYILQVIVILAIAFILGGIVGYFLKKFFGCNEEETHTAAAASSDSVSKPAMPASANLTTDIDVSGDDKSASSAVAPLASSKTAASKAPAKTTAAKKAPVARKTAAKTSAAKKSTPTRNKAPATKAAAPKKPAAKKVTAAAAKADDLKLIKGVGKLNEKRLHEEGINTFAQVAAWKKVDIADFDEKLNFKGRIEREEWVPQAKLLAKGSSAGKPAAKKTTAAKPKAASTAAKTSAAKKPAAKKPATKRAAPAKKAAPAKSNKPDDLKLIKGVGKGIETKLNKAGITQYSQIAKWKKADITEFDEKLSFKGRIERDEWISQAKILAKGGATEFSKRAAKGEVPSSTTKK